MEWIATLLRRIDPARLQIIVCAGEDGPLAEALRRYADRGRGGVTHEPAADYVASDGTDDRLRAAYDALPAAERAALHDARADELERRGELSLDARRDPVPPRARQRSRAAPEPSGPRRAPALHALGLL